MAAHYLKGDGLPRLVRSGGVQIDRYGLATATAVWWAYNHATLLSSGVAYIGAPHPDALSLRCEHMSFVNSYQGSTLEAVYAGVLSGEMPDPIDELDTAVMEAPIEAHPNFADFAGTPAAPLNGAVFLQDGAGNWRFDQFGPAAPASFRGVTSFEVPTSVSRRTTITTFEPEANEVGLRRVPFNTFGIDRDWLLVRCSSQKRGNVYVTKYEWKASGPYGWNHSIYGT